jgi:hypothetical protein
LTRDNSIGYGTKRRKTAFFSLFRRKTTTYKRQWMANKQSFFPRLFVTGYVHIYLIKLSGAGDVIGAGAGAAIRI